MALDNLKLAVSGLTNRIYAGYVSKNNQTWTQKVDVTEMFVEVMVDRFIGTSIVGAQGDKRFQITVEEISRTA